MTSLLVSVMKILEPVRNGTTEVSALCSAGPVRSKVLQTSNRAGISNGLERIRTDSTGKERKAVLKAILLCFFFVKPKTEAEN